MIWLDRFRSWLGRFWPPPPAPEPFVLNDVIAAELDHIHRHRHPAKSKKDMLAGSLVGLALSGGGIRSATTNLGVLQALSRMKILPMVDYLSTVSGGGYIGAAMSSLLSWNGTTGVTPPGLCAGFTFNAVQSPKFGTRWANFPFREEFDEGGIHRPLGAELAAHLRTHGNFLVARWGMLRRETMRSIGHLVTGTVYSVLAAMLTLFAVSAGYQTLVLVAVPEIHRVLADTTQRPGWPSSLPRPMADSATTVVQVRDSSCARGAAPCVHKTTTTLSSPTLTSRIRRNAQLLGGVLIGSWKTGLKGEGMWEDVPLAMVPLVAGACSGAAMILLIFAVVSICCRRYFTRTSAEPLSRPLRGESAEDSFERGLLWGIGLALTLAVIAISVVLHRAILSFEGPEQLAGLFVPFAVLAGARVLGAVIGVVVLPYLPVWTRRMRSFWGAVQAITMYGAWSLLLLGLLPLVIYAVRDHAGGVGIGAIGSLLVTRLLTSRSDAGKTRFALPAALRNALLGTAVTLVLLLGLVFFAAIVARRVGDSWEALPYVAIPVIVLVILALFVDQNRISPHYFYRDRLAETYLRSELPDTARRQRLFRDAMEMRLSCLHGEPAPMPGARWCNPAPYHLISAAINLAGSRDLTRKDRKSGYWLFSKLYCGSIHTGFRSTKDYRDDDTKLARAIAISGAAASSAMGQGTFFAQAFATVLFNIRLGHWMENPMYATSLRRREGTIDLRYPWRSFVWPWYLWREITTATVETSRLVNLSDGGHTGDNVGIYPLLQRRCKVIIACDAECDSALTFGSFTEALRHAYVDMGISVDIDLSLIRPDKTTGKSRSHSAVGRIRYPDRPNQESFLIYLKNSLTGDEPEPILNYWSDRPEFPHESTADQFFDDAQFESYRALGVHLAEHTFGLWTSSKWFHVVRDHHSPTSCQEPVP